MLLVTDPLPYGPSGYSLPAAPPFCTLFMLCMPLHIDAKIIRNPSQNRYSLQGVHFSMTADRGKAATRRAGTGLGGC